MGWTVGWAVRWTMSGNRILKSSEESERASVALDLNARNRLGGHVSIKNTDKYDTFMSGGLQNTDKRTRKESPVPHDTDDDLFMGTEDLLSQQEDEDEQDDEGEEEFGLSRQDLPASINWKIRNQELLMRFLTAVRLKNLPFTNILFVSRSSSDPVSPSLRESYRYSEYRLQLDLLHGYMRHSRDCIGISGGRIRLAQTWRRVSGRKPFPQPKIPTRSHVYPQEPTYTQKHPGRGGRSQDGMAVGLKPR